MILSMMVVVMVLMVLLQPFPLPPLLVHARVLEVLPINPGHPSSSKLLEIHQPAKLSSH